RGGYSGNLGALAFSPDGSLLAGSPNAQRGVVLWDLTAGLETRSLPLSKESEGLGIASGGTRIALSTPKGLEIVSPGDGKTEQTLPLSKEFLHHARPGFSHDGSLLAYSPEDGKVTVVEIPGGKVRASIDIKKMGDVQNLVFSADGK